MTYVGMDLLNFRLDGLCEGGYNGCRVNGSSFVEASYSFWMGEKKWFGRAEELELTLSRTFPFAN